MRSFIVVVLALANFACAEVSQATSENTAYGYLAKIGIPEAERIRKAEEKGLLTRIIGGTPASLGQTPYQAGLLIDIIDRENLAICGGSVLTNNRVITAAHCWTDGINQAWRFTVVLGSVTIFTGGVRQQTSIIAVHPQWNPDLVRNDVAVIYLTTSVPFSNIISPISLPSGSELNEDFAGENAVASGFGITGDGVPIQPNQFLSHVTLNVITNRVCAPSFFFLIQSSNLCTSTRGTISTCNGDSGGPLVVTRGNRNILIGVTSFINGLVGCEGGLPAAFARVTSFVDFFQQHM